MLFNTNFSQFNVYIIAGREEDSASLALTASEYINNPICVEML